MSLIYPQEILHSGKNAGVEVGRPKGLWTFYIKFSRSWMPYLWREINIPFNKLFIQQVVHAINTYQVLIVYYLPPNNSILQAFQFVSQKLRLNTTEKREWNCRSIIIFHWSEIKQNTHSIFRQLEKSVGSHHEPLDSYNGEHETSVKKAQFLTINYEYLSSSKLLGWLQTWVGLILRKDSGSLYFDFNLYCFVVLSASVVLSAVFSMLDCQHEL